MGRSSRAAKQVNNIPTQDLQALLSQDFENAIRVGVNQYLADLGLAIVQALMQGEVDNLCGVKNSRKTQGEAVRWGTQQGVVQVRGAKEHIQRPRVRTKDGKSEIDLETYSAFNKKSVLSEEILVAVGAGVSTRQYQSIVGTELRKHGVSRSAVSRRVIEQSSHALELFRARRWDRTNFVALLLDGVRIGKQMVIAAVGVDLSGCKHVLGWRIGSTENEVVCRDLIRQLIDAGLKIDNDYLFVIDGSKALLQAIRATFGMNVQVQRCQEHKIRDVEGYLPFKHRAGFRAKLQTAFNERTYKKASDRLQNIRSQLLIISEPAANSLTEGLEHTLTLHRLDIRGGVRESLRTTNIIEAAFSRLRQHTRNVNSWSDAEQVNRWLALGLARVEKGFRRLPGYRQLAKLNKKVKEHTALQNPNN